MKLIVSHQDEMGRVSATLEIPDGVTFTPEAVVKYGDALVEIVMGSMEPMADFPDDTEPPPELGGFFPINN